MSDKLCILGWGRAGKDECAGFMNDHLGLPYAGSTSWAALPLMAEKLGIHQQLAWERRHLNRELWKRSCDEFRRDNPTHLIHRAFATSLNGRVVTGLRDREEIFAAQKENIFKHYVWVDRPGIPRDSTVTFGPGDCDSFIRNDGSPRRFHKNIVQWVISVGLNPPKFSGYAAEVFEDLDP